jgi:hypothetical protein
VNEYPADQPAYHAILKKTKIRRAFFFGTVLIYIPALMIVHAISPTNRAMGTVFCVWLAFLIIATIGVALCRCPRCGNYFHLNGMTLLILRKCLHCQHHISAKKQS